MKFSSYAIILFLGIFIINFTSCENDVDEPPLMPSQEYLIMNYTYFNTLSSGLSGDLSYKVAWNAVKYWDSIVSVHKNIPFDAYKKALSTSATYVNINQWSWPFDFMTGSTAYLGEMTSQELNYYGTTDVDSVAWTLTAAQIGTNEAYTYLYGMSAVNDSGGWWIVKAPPQNFLKAEWYKANGKLISLKYTYIYPSHINNGAFIEYKPLPGTDFDKSFSIKLNVFPKYPEYNNDTITIKWNTKTSSGQVLVNGTQLGTGWDF